MDKDFWVSDDITHHNQTTDPKAIRNHREMISMIDSQGGLKGKALDMGGRNYFTEMLEAKFNVKVDSTSGDLDEMLDCPSSHYDSIVYNNVIEHQFNPLFTLQQLHKTLKDSGCIFLGTPLKPHWITSSPCHFHEFNDYEYRKLIARAEFKVIAEKKFYRHLRFDGIRGLLGSLHTSQVVSVLVKM
jgi:SAM-dependent methyltransferase